MREGSNFTVVSSHRIGSRQVLLFVGRLFGDGFVLSHFWLALGVAFDVPVSRRFRLTHFSACFRFWYSTLSWVEESIGIPFPTQLIGAHTFDLLVNYTLKQVPLWKQITVGHIPIKSFFILTSIALSNETAADDYFPRMGLKNLGPSQKRPKKRVFNSK